MKGRHSFILFHFVYMCGGPCHLPSFKQCSGTLFSSENSLFYAVMEKINIPEFVLLYYVNIINIKNLHLNFFSKTTNCPFKKDKKSSKMDIKRFRFGINLFV